MTPDIVIVLPHLSHQTLHRPMWLAFLHYHHMRLDPGIIREFMSVFSIKNTDEFALCLPKVKDHQRFNPVVTAPTCTMTWLEPQTTEEPPSSWTSVEGMSSTAQWATIVAIAKARELEQNLQRGKILTQKKTGWKSSHGITKASARFKGKAKAKDVPVATCPRPG
jgi:hypothetical protein